MSKRWTSAIGGGRRRALLKGGLVAATAAALPRAGQAQVRGIPAAPGQSVGSGFPDADRPIRFIVPFPPGGTSDLRARQVSAVIAQQQGWKIFIENRSGASGTIGSDQALRAPADGHTLLLGTIGTLAINPHLLVNQPYDVATDVQPITQFSRSVSMLMAHRDSGIRSLADLERRTRSEGPLAFASTGNATIGHMVADLYQRRAGIALTHVPYRGTAPAVLDFSSGQVPLLVETPAAVWPMLQSGLAVPLAVTSAERMPQLPQVATFAEQGYPDLVLDTWQGVVTRRGVPAATLARLHQAFVAALRHPDVVRSHEEQVNVVVANTPEAFAELMRRESARWGDVVKETGARLS